MISDRMCDWVSSSLFVGVPGCVCVGVKWMIGSWMCGGVVLVDWFTRRWLGYKYRQAERHWRPPNFSLLIIKEWGACLIIVNKYILLLIMNIGVGLKSYWGYWGREERVLIRPSTYRSDWGVTVLLYNKKKDKTFTKQIFQIKIPWLLSRKRTSCQISPRWVATVCNFNIILAIFH